MKNILSTPAGDIPVYHGSSVLPDKSPAETAAIAAALERLYGSYNHRRFVHPDPLIFLYDFPDTADREIVGLLASALAYGNVNAIIKSAEKALYMLGAYRDESPVHGFSSRLRRQTLKKIQSDCQGFRHRFTTDEELGLLAYAAARLQSDYGSLEKCFAEGFNGRQHENVLLPLTAFSHRLNSFFPGRSSLVPACTVRATTMLSSAAKRMNLYLKWMCRHDNVDPGGWSAISPSMLIIPLDIHMYRFGRLLKFTNRKTQDMKTAIEITRNFRLLSPDDPLKYDFALTRLGIRPELGPEELFDRRPNCIDVRL